LHVPDRHGRLEDVVLGFDNLQQYLQGHPYFGCTVGRFANRIAGGRFTLDGKSYQLAINNGPNHLHGGIKGFDKALWKATPQGGAAVHFSHTSPDGDEGYPGNLELNLQVTLSNANELRLEYTAKCDHSTPLNLTNHSYFNLAARGKILDHELMLTARRFTPSDEHSIPTGEIRDVAGTPMDFTQPAAIGARFSQLMNQPVGYDHNFVLDNQGKLVLAARVSDPSTGRVMEAFTTEPGVQLYTANYFDGTLTGKNGICYTQHSALCLETQHYPDSVNKPQFPSAILRPGQLYRQTTIYKFSTQPPL
jgi:aldose 1-epimerase